MNQFLVLCVLTSLTSSLPQDRNLNDENDVEYNLTTNFKSNKSKELNFLSALSRSINFTTDDELNTIKISSNSTQIDNLVEDPLQTEFEDILLNNLNDSDIEMSSFKFIDEVTNTISEKPNDEILSNLLKNNIINTEINEIKILQSDLNPNSGAINDSLIEISSRFSDTSVFENETEESKIDDKNINITEEDFVNEERNEETTQDSAETEHDCSLFNEEKSTDKLINKKLEKSGRSLNRDIGALPAVLSESFTLSPRHIFTRFKLNFYNFENSDKSNL